MRYGIESLLMSHYDIVGIPQKGYQVYFPTDHKEFVVRGGYLLERDSLFPKETVGVRILKSSRFKQIRGTDEN